MINQSIGNYVDSAMTIFGAETNLRRQLPSVYDGLKPVYRRLINTAIKLGNGNFIKTANIIGTTMGTTHPHGDSSMINPVSNMVRWKIFDGHGNHGLKSLRGPDKDKDPAAPRYTGARISQGYDKFFHNLMPYVPYDEAELEGNVEPRFLPTPYPICLTHGTLGIGQGVNCRIPAFTMKSIHEAFIHDDPTLLEAPFGLELVKDQSELESLWTTGLGKLTYRYRVYADNYDGGYGVFIQGEAELFKPNLAPLNDLVDQQKIYITDNSSKQSRLILGINKRIRMDYDELLGMARRAATHSKTFRLTVADNDTFYIIPMRSWCAFTYENYCNIVRSYQNDNINKLEFNYKVYKYTKQVARAIIDHEEYSTEDIVNLINVPECNYDVVDAISAKSLRTLMRMDTDSKLRSIESKLEEFRSIEPNKFIQSVIDEFD